MYKKFIRPILFLLPPETIHRLIFGLLRFARHIPGTPPLLQKIYAVKNSRLQRELWGLKFPNPVGIAAGLDKEAKAFDMLANMGFGFVEIGTVTPLPQPGNPKPRLFRLKKDSALINRMGFNHKGVEHTITQLKKRPKGVIVGGNIGKNTLTPNEKAADDYEICFEKLYPYVDYFVVNVSCPNISDLRQLQDKEALLDILNRITALRQKKKTKKPVLLKISPDLNNAQIDDVIEIISEAAIEGIVATNTTIGRDGLSYTQAQIDDFGKGGLSGKPLRKRSTEVIRYINQKTQGKIPIIGVGGILSPHDALEKLNAGATLVQVYTGFIYEGPAMAKKINRQILK